MMKRCGKIVLGWAVFSMLVATAGAQESAPASAPAKPKIPSVEEIKDATKKFEDVFKTEITAATKPAQISEVVTKIKANFAAETDSAVKYVMLTRMAGLQNQTGDIIAAVETLGEIAKHFQTSGYGRHVEAVSNATKLVRNNDQRVRLLLFALTTTEEAMAAEDFESAKSLCASALTVARPLGSVEMVAEITAISTNLRETELAVGDFLKAKAALEAKADDADANAKVGKYLCFFIADWDKGLPALAKGSDAQLKTAAENELKGVAAEAKGTMTAEEKVKRGDQWWTMAAAAGKVPKINMQARAARWYDSAYSSIESLLEKDRVLKKLSEYGEADAARKKSNSASIVERVFIGKWSIPIQGGRGIITLAADRTSSCSWRPAKGSWELVNSELVVTWGDGWHDVFRFSPTGFTKSGYGPGVDISTVDKTAAPTMKVK